MMSGSQIYPPLVLPLTTHPCFVIARSAATKQSSARWIATPDYVGLAMTIQGRSGADSRLYFFP